MRENGVIILGKGESRARLSEYMGAGCGDVWTLNDDFIQGVTTKHFDIHDPLISGDTFAKMDKDTPVIVMTEDGLPEDQARQLYPMDAVRRFFGWTRGREYLATTPAYMLALAILNRLSPIYLLGVDFSHTNRPESIWERPCVEFLIGWGRCMGLTIEITEESDLLATGTAQCRIPYGSRGFDQKALRPDGFVLPRGVEVRIA